MSARDEQRGAVRCTSPMRYFIVDGERFFTPIPLMSLMRTTPWRCVSTFSSALSITWAVQVATSGYARATAHTGGRARWRSCQR